ncbi:MAG: 3-oxoacyl-[acyl-carrier-protein] synthase III C-terminal domain-containing protein [Acidimicrobiales bacterium]
MRCRRSPTGPTGAPRSQFGDGASGGPGAPRPGRDARARPRCRRQPPAHPVLRSRRAHPDGRAGGVQEGGPAVAQSVENVLGKAGLEATDVDVVIPHQANIRIIEAVCQRLGIPMEKTHNVLDHTGNTSSASIPLALAAADAAGALEPERIVLMSGFGAGDGLGIGGAAMVTDGRGAGHRRQSRHRCGDRPPIRGRWLPRRGRRVRARPMASTA